MKILNNILKLKRSGFFDIFFGGIASKLVAFFSSILIVRLVSKTDYAVLSYADNIYSYIVLFSGIGMASAILKYCVCDDDSKNNAYFNFAFFWGSLFQLTILLVLFLITYNIEYPFNGVKRILYSLLPYGFLYYWVQLFQNFFRTKFENRKYAMMSFLQVALTLLFCIVTVTYFGVIGIPISRTIAMIVSVAIFLPTFIKYYRGFNFSNGLSSNEIKAFLTLALSMLVSNVFSMIMPTNEMFLINNILKNESITANYKVATLIPSQLPFITSTLVIYYFPLLAKRNAEIDTWHYSVKIGINTFLLNLVITIMGCVFTPFIVNLIYGQDYADISDLSILIWLSFFVNAGFRMLPMNILPALGYVKVNVIIAVASAIILFAFDYITLKTIGINGAVISRLIVNFLSGLAYWIYLYLKCVKH